ncbi:MAG: hypothetical protein EPN98_18700 [Phenylobacterium sp.]|uniref:acyltransferase family protein n=1 Tax=Phenylobacterium sp. TaxID=1871053 RepID=UPI00122A4FA2|nr:acyltransferase family protein [Phenylobacterium sp.]TAL29825.1 MAG: hypothetical protein EPN98_18700 [Phenylobacterium sp.]
MATDTASGAERLHALDAVRGFALVLGIFFHATMSFLPSEGPTWMISDPQRSTPFAVAFFTLHIFRMTTFFVIAGFFARMLFHRRGLAGFARDRGKRIALPLVASWLPVFVLIVGATIAGTLIQYDGAPPFRPPPADPNPPPLPFPLTHLWFLYLLVILYVLSLAGRTAIVAVDRNEALRGLVDRWLALLVRGGVAPLLLALPLALALPGYSRWMMWMGVPTPDSSLIPNLPAFAEFATAFVFGWMLQRQPDLLGAIQRWWPVHLAAALALTIALLAQAGLVATTATNLPGVDRQLFAANYAFAAWTWSFAFIGLAMQFMSGFSAWRRYLADASYWLYLIHLPLVILLQGLVARFDAPPEFKYALILLVAFPLMLASYQTMVRYTWLGAILNGRRQPRTGARIPATSASGQEPA